MPDETAGAILRLILYCCRRHSSYSLERAWEIQTAVRGLKVRVPGLQEATVAALAAGASSGASSSHQDWEMDLAALKERVSDLPFEIVPMGVDCTMFVPDGDQEVLCEDLKRSIPFAKDRLVTRGGEAVTERRGTAWVAEGGIGALAYSGKLMPPHSPVPDLVARMMRAVENKLDLPSPFFDCALCNHYSSADAACKFHTDPEHSTVWHTTTVVVATGSDRKFSFKPVAGWTEWDRFQVPAPVRAGTVSVFAGDLVVMKDNCNDAFFHAVHAGVTDDQRISLVLKRAIDRGNGRRGHGLPGHGRRSRKRNS